MRSAIFRPLALGGLLLAVTACGTDGEGGSVAVEGGDHSVVDVSATRDRVSTIRVERGSISTVVTASGSILPRRVTPLGPGVGGRLVRVFVNVGDEVEKGDPIFLIDPESYRIALQEAAAGLSLARAELADAEEEARRTRTLARKHMVSQQHYDRARTRVAVARARVEQAESRSARAGSNLEQTMVRAPYGGSVVERRAHEGMMATVRPNTTVAVLQETKALEAVLDIPEASLAVVRPGDLVELFLDGSVAPIESRVSVVSDRIDLASRTYEVRVPILDPARVKSGAFVRGRIEPSAKTAVLLVDRAALTTRDGKTLAFRIVGGVAELVAVKLGIVNTSKAEVLAGLSEGDEVAVGKSVARLADGERVETELITEPPRTSLAVLPGNRR